MYESIKQLSGQSTFMYNFMAGSIAGTVMHF